ncbi:MAG: type II secretion system F family protein [Patescibacteria group bacterium]
MLYKYKAVKNGAEYEGEKEAPDKIALYGEIKKEGGVVVSVEEEKSKGGDKFSFHLGSGIKADEKISFAKNLAVMIEAGISVSRALSIIEKQTSNKHLFKILSSLRNLIDSGKSLSESMAEHSAVFSNLFVMMVKAGEESGKLVESLRIVASQMERGNQLTKKIKGAMIYPSIVIVIMILLGIVLMVFMVPTLTETFIGLNIKLPLPTRIMIGISDALRHNLILFLGSFMLLVLGSFYFLKTAKGKRFSDTMLLHLPLIAVITKEVNSARTARTLSSLISSGVDIVVAISITRDVLQNSYYKTILDGAAKTIEKGGALSVVFSEAKKLYPVYVGEMTAVGEETGELSKMLENIADYYEGEVDQRTKNLSTVIEPVLMVLIGIAVGLFAVSMLLPTYSLVDVIGA